MIDRPPVLTDEELLRIREHGSYNINAVNWEPRLIASRERDDTAEYYTAKIKELLQEVEGWLLYGKQTVGSPVQFYAGTRHFRKEFLIPVKDWDKFWQELKERWE